MPMYTGIDEEQKHESIHCESANTNPNTPGHCLLLPGRRLDLKALLKKKKFRDPHGYKKGALAAFSELEQAGLGVGETVNTKYGSVSKDVHAGLCRALKKIACNHTDIFNEYNCSVRRHIEEGICMPAIVFGHYITTGLQCYCTFGVMYITIMGTVTTSSKHNL